MGGARLFDGITHTTAAGRRFVLISEWLRGIMSMFFFFFSFFQTSQDEGNMKGHSLNDSQEGKKDMTK